MHAVKPANRFGRVGGNPQSAPSSQSASSASSPAPPYSDVASLVDQLKAKGLEPEDEIMLAHLNQIDMHGQSREYYHNAAEACERAKDLHAIHVKMVRYLGAMETGRLSERDYEALKLELKQRREEEERLQAEEEAKRRAEEERLQAEREAKRREEERVRAEEEAKQQERRLQQALLEKRWRARDEEYRLFMQRTWDEEDRRRAKEEELRRMAEEEQQRKLWEAQQVLLEEQRRREEELRVYNEAIERERRNEERIRRWTEMRQQRAWQEQVERQNREYAEWIRLAREFAEQERRAAQEEAVARYQAEAVASYETLWKALKAKKYPPDSFSYASFPLPVFDNTLKPRPDAITLEAVAEFVLSPLRTDAGLKSRKQRINTEKLLWHSDKFKTDILSLVLEEDREDMELAADKIIRILNIMLKKEL
ncbi:hypothetical protein LXA43DRAFT_992865 [Ganoderma leucocontextum]|nr:hypothetical protein LXA43DRAFT_992865 [Ganoderma leucocontextum]